MTEWYTITNRGNAWLRQTNRFIFGTYKSIGLRMSNSIMHRHISYIYVVASSRVWNLCSNANRLERRCGGSPSYSIISFRLWYPMIYNCNYKDIANVLLLGISLWKYNTQSMYCELSNIRYILDKKNWEVKFNPERPEGFEKELRCATKYGFHNSHDVVLGRWYKDLKPLVKSIRLTFL